MSTIASEGDLAIRPIRDERGEYELLVRWRSDPRIIEFYGGRDRPHTLEMVMEKFVPRVRGETEVTACFITRRDEPIGYIQFYPVLDPLEYGLEDATETLGIDIFLGEPELFGQGIGTRALDMLCKQLLSQPDVKRLVIDPLVTNLRAIRSYEKAGFSKVEILPARDMHEGSLRDVLLMIRER